MYVSVYVRVYACVSVRLSNALVYTVHVRQRAILSPTNEMADNVNSALLKFNRYHLK